MDRPLDETISERRRQEHRGPRVRHHSSGPYNGIRKSSSRNEHHGNFDRDWVHDKYDDGAQPRNGSRLSRSLITDRLPPERDEIPQGAKLRIDNLHYDLNEAELEELFSRIGRVQKTSIKYDRAGRSSGTAFVTYESELSARRAIREYDGANANGQPIHLRLVPLAPAAPATQTRNPFDMAQPPSRSLFDRITPALRSDARQRERYRSLSSERPPINEGGRRSTGNVDRQLPRRRSRSPFRPTRYGMRGGGPSRGRLGGRKDDSSRDAQNRRGIVREGRPKKTQDELDAEMEDYWESNKQNDDTAKASSDPVNGTDTVNDGHANHLSQGLANDDIDTEMIE